MDNYYSEFSMMLVKAIKLNDANVVESLLSNTLSLLGEENQDEVRIIFSNLDNYQAGDIVKDVFNKYFSIGENKV